jgi:protein TonB
MTASLLREFMPYGAPDLQDAERPHLVRALALGSLLASSLFALAWSLSVMFPHPGSGMHKIIANPIDVSPDVTVPPPLVAPMPIAKPTAAKPEVGVPLPVEDTPEMLDKPAMATAGTSGPATTGATSEDHPAPPPVPVNVGPVNQPGQVLFVDELPVPAREVKPEYPEIARQAGVEGLVIIDALIGTDGRVVEVHIDPRINVVMLNESALEAARKWVFTPAIDKGQPVMVWIKLPFRYTLH